MCTTLHNVTKLPSTMAMYTWNHLRFILFFGITCITHVMNAAVNDLKSITMNCLLVDNCFIYNIITKIFEILTFLNIRTCSEMCSTEYMTLWVVSNFSNGRICFNRLGQTLRSWFCDHVIPFCEYMYFALNQCHFNESSRSCLSYFDAFASITPVRADKMNNACSRVDVILLPNHESLVTESCYRERLE